MTPIVKRLLPLLILLLTAPFVTRAQTINAASCNSSDVQTALNSVAADGTTVNIPVGTCAWATTVTYNQVHSTTIQGQSTTTGTCGPGGTCTATDSTIVVDNLSRGAGCGSPDNPALQINTAAGKSFRMTGLTFQFTGTQTCNGSIVVSGSSHSIRIDHNHFHQQYSTGLHPSDWTLGVIDHNLFDAPVGQIWNGIKFEESNWNGNDGLQVGDNSWASPTTFGSGNFMYVENNFFTTTQTGALSYGNDCTSGGRYVWRYNVMNDVLLQTHPTGGGARHRGCRATEIYNNDASTGKGTNSTFNFFFLSSGTSLIWGNKVSNDYQNFVTIHSDRRDTITYQQSNAPNGWGYCGTSFNGTGSGWDQNSNTSTGYRCLDQPGQGVGQQMVNDFPNVQNQTTGTISWPHEALEPVYEWLNTSAATTYFSNYETDALFPNSDYYLYTASFTGASGTGSGTLAGRPSNCTAGVAYWATDTTTLYTCNSGGNAWTTYYTPYTYPHPLVSGGGNSGTPVAPTNLTATVQP